MSSASSSVPPRDYAISTEGSRVKRVMFEKCCSFFWMFRTCKLTWWSPATFCCDHWTLWRFGCLAEYGGICDPFNTEDCILLDKVSDYKLMTEINSESVCGLLCFYVCVFSTHAEMMPDSPYRTLPVLQSIEPSHRHQQGMCHECVWVCLAL